MENTHLPLTPGGVEAFLASDMVEGIGKVYARRLVEAYGTDILRRLLDEPESVVGIPGLGEARLRSASESLRELKYPVELLAFLHSCGVHELFIGRIFGKYRKRAEEIILTDPYSMVEDVWRLSFHTADKIGRALGIADDDPRRLRGALLTAVKNYAEQGHLFATPEEAFLHAARIAGVSPGKASEAMGSLVVDGRLVSSRGGLYLPVFYQAERQGAERLMRLAASGRTPVDTASIPERDVAGHPYTPDQKEGIALVLENPVAVLTGGPGSGKTTVLKGVLDILEKEGKRVTLVAPTGRAAKRMSTLTGRDAQTIHRLLGYRQGEGFHRKKVDTDVLVIDEGSMMEQVLFNHLLQGIPAGTKVVMVGDVDQLPAIGAGDVLRDLMDSDMVPVARLTGNHRQGAGSGIAAGAAEIRQGRLPTPDEEDFMFVEEKGTRAIHDRILELVAVGLPERKGIPSAEILVVTPQQMGPLGARQLNIDLQQRLNPDSPEVRRGQTLFRLGDPVMQTANSRDRNLYNGETGRIVEVFPEEGALTVEFSDGHRSRYARTELSELTLAYATTVHKLQGSEVPYMVMPVTMAHEPMLYRNLLYTGVSRATRLCVMVGEVDALRYAVENDRDRSRNSNFKSRLRDGSSSGNQSVGETALA